MREEGKTRFLQDVETHQLTVLRDDGVHRHLQFRRPGTYCMGFDIITWPGYLCYTGDMGTYVFRRTEDMFQFFRSNKPGELRINPSYWSEKVEAADRACGITEYSEETFRACVAEWLDEMEASAELRAALERELSCLAYDGEHEALRAVLQFQYEGDHPFQDFWEVNLREYTHRFLWCCYAIVWGIQQYDALKKAA